MDSKQWRGLIHAYRDHIALDSRARVITLHEGQTPLIRADRLSRTISKDAKFDLYLKYEGLNPTGSFKDRGMTVAISQALHSGAKAVICASTGNTAASAAAYAARANLKCIVLVPKGNIALGKLSATIAYGAEVIAIESSFDQGLQMVRDIVRRKPVVLVNSVSPWRIEGQKTGAFEICDQLEGRAPDWHSLPVGNAGNITASWKGYQEYGKGLPKLLGTQAQGAAPIVTGRRVENPETIATAIRIGNPARWQEALQALDESGGIITSVSDEKIVEAWRMLARIEGVFVEPASAAGLAGLIAQIEAKYIDLEGKTAVIVLTGHGLKDPSFAMERGIAPQTMPADIDQLEAYLDGLGV